MSKAPNELQDRPEQEGAGATQGIAFEGVRIGEGRYLLAKNRLDCLLHEGRQQQAEKIPVRLAPQGGNGRQSEKADCEKEDGMSDEMIMCGAEDLAEGGGEGRPDGTEPIEREPENDQQCQGRPAESDHILQCGKMPLAHSSVQ